ncbi:hypothetical protein TWF569_010080 [Orbilia oligospora]|nr:hypothetical protein TWF569_010080 [Orbilia oligospora]
MLHPETFDGHGYYYPLGNSPAINLVGFLPPEIDAEILLLGCGDVRNILFTLFTESSESANKVHRKYHFTCCDFEGAVIARNILLLAMILKNEEASTMWPIYYDIFMSETCSQALKSHLAELLSASEDIESWLKSDLGKVLTVGSKYTLAVVRRLWSAWAKSLDEKGKGQRRKSVKRELANIVKERHSKGSILSVARSAGPLTIEVMRASMDHFNHYWKHGTTDHHHTEKPPVSNPTFSLTKYGRKFSVHYGTNPLAGFHLSTAVVPFGSKDFQPMKSSLDFTPLVKCAKEEFNLWCQSFRNAQENNTFTICFFVDEALELCGSLSPKIDVTGIKEINENNATSKGYLHNHPTQFNVIDISNLIDHVGTYNILLSILALLRKDHISYLNTETLLKHEFNIDRGNEALYNVFGVDPASVFALLGITVVDFMCAQTSISQVSEHQLEAFADGEQRHGRLVWKWIPSFRPEGLNEDCTSISQEPKFLYDVRNMVDFLAAIYKKLFSIENHTWSLQQMEDCVKKRKPINILQHNTRMTFSLLLQKVKRLTSATVNWNELMERLLLFVTRDCGCFIAPCFVQEQDALNLLHKVKTVDYLDIPPSLAATKFRSVKGHRTSKINYESVLTCVTLSVPINAFNKLSMRDMKQVGTPQLQLTLSCGDLMNHFCAIQRKFGNLDAIDGAEPGEIYFERNAPKFKEDLDGWMGTSSILYSCMVPTWFLMLIGCKVSLNVVSNPMTSLLITELGPFMKLFETDVDDHKSVRLSTMFPLAKTFLRVPTGLKTAKDLYNTRFGASSTLTGDTSKGGPTPKPSGLQLEYTFLMLGRTRRLERQQASGLGPLPGSLDYGTHPMISRIVYRWSVESDHSLVKLLEDKATISTTREGSSGIRVHLGPSSKLIIFPFPIGEPIKLSVARKSKYIEIDAPMYNGFMRAPLYSQFPIVIANKSLRSIVPWGMHRINLDKSPVVLIDLLKHGKSGYDWISSAATFSLSRQERANINSCTQKYFGDLMSEIKETIHMIIIRYLGIQGFQHNCFVLSCEGVGGYMLIYVKDIRLDLSGQNITADCALVPFEDNNLPQLAPNLVDFHHAPLRSSPEESKAWLQIAPNLVERCRTWQHKPSCEYIKSSRIPLSAPGLRIGDPPICNCGKGIFPKAFYDDPVIKPFLPHATRAALGLLFPPPYSKQLQNMRDLISKTSGLSLPKILSEEPKKTGCALCGKEEDGDRKLRKCTACMNVEYCSKECQKKDWKAHKKTHGT